MTTAEYGYLFIIHSDPVKADKKPWMYSFDEEEVLTELDILQQTVGRTTGTVFYIEEQYVLRA